MASLTNILAQMGDYLRAGASWAQVGPARFNAIMAAIRGLADGDNLESGPGIRLRKGGGKVVITVDSGRGSVGAFSTSFFVSAADVTNGESTANKVAVTAGAINNEICDTLTGDTALEVSDGDKIFIHLEVDADGVVVPYTVEVLKGSSVPDNTTTDGYTILASVAVVDGGTVVTPLAWNYSQVKLCGQAGASTVYLWGGFGS